MQTVSEHEDSVNSALTHPCWKTGQWNTIVQKNQVRYSEKKQNWGKDWQEDRVHQQLRLSNFGDYDFITVLYALASKN